MSAGAWAALPAAVMMWQTMMVVMMAPTAAPWLRAAATFSPDRSPLAAATGFGAGYFLLWMPFSLALAALQLSLRHPLSAPAGALVLLAAGLYQFSPLKRACLRHCRNPASYLLSHWDNGPLSPLRLGARHGVICLGCCWALMLTALALGLMNYLWMALIAVVVFAEQTMPRAGWLRPAFGLVLVALALWTFRG